METTKLKHTESKAYFTGGGKNNFPIVCCIYLTINNIHNINNYNSAPP